MSPTRVQDELPREFPLVGRKDELQRLFRIFGAGPTLRLLVGEGGVGKSRLADTLSREAARRDWRVLTARAYPVEQGVPYAVMAEALVPFLGGLEPATLTVLTRGREGDLRRLFPALDGEATKDPAGPDSEELKTRLYWTLSTALEGLAQRQPTLLVVDDVHWSDPSSLSLLHFLVRHIESDAFRVVATCTAEHRTRNSHLIEVERSLESLRLLERTQLSPLGLGEIEELLTGVFDVSGAAVKDFADRLFGWTRGNAYFVEQTLRSLVDEGRLFRSNGTWLGWEARDLALPSTVRDAVTHRFGSLSRQAQDAAQHMAALGRPVRLEVLQEILGLEASELAGVVEELVDTGAVEEEARDRLILLKFRHPLTRESLYRDLAQIRRGLLHKRIAAALEAVYGEAATEHADELAFHLSRASGVAEPRTVGYLELAGSDAVERHADEEAVDYLAAALRAAEELTSPLEPATEDRLRRLLARAQTSAGRFQEAREQLERLLARAEASGDRAAQADVLRHLGINSTFLGRHADALNEFEAARAVVPEDAPTVGAGIELAAGITLQQLGRAEESRQRLVEALRLAELVKDDGLLAWVHRALALINTFGGNSGTARRHAAEAIDRGRAAKDREAVFWGEWVLATLEGLTQGPAPMEPWMAAARESAEALGSPVLDLHVDELELEYLYFTGEWDQALALGTRAIHRARALHKRALVVRLLVWTSSVYIGRGDLDGARLLVDEAVELAGVASGSAPFASDVHAALPALIGLAALRLAERRLDDALESGQAGLALAEASGYVIWALHRLLPIVGEAYVRLDDVERARQVLERFQDEGRRMDHGMSLLWAKAGQALVTWHSGDLEEGARLLGEAAEAMDAMGIPYEAARIRRQHAGRLADLNQTDAARAALDQASDVFQRLGAEPELRATRGMYEEIGVTRRGPTGGPDGRAGLSSREWQVAELVAERKSNHEIARILGIAYRTVTTHCQNIYKKLELEDGPKRIMLGDRVREGRLTPPD